MPHDFSVDKKTGIILVTVCGLMGVLLFIAGFLLGVQYHVSLKPPALTVQSSTAKVKQAKLEVPAAKPVPKPPEVAAASVGAAPAITPTQPAQQPAIGTSAQSAAQSASTPLAGQAKNTSAEAANQPSTTPAVSSAPSAPPAVAQTNPSPAAAVASTQADEPEYSIQIGAFLNPKNAARLVKDLQQKGYKAKIFIATGSKYRVWHTVRIGPFKDIEAASKRARLFTQSAHMLALVRPAHSL